MTERLHTSPTDVAMRRLSHLLRVQTAKADQLKANEAMNRAVESARAGGCSESEIKASVALIERAATSRSP
jgi:hypothetical protein